MRFFLFLSVNSALPHIISNTKRPMLPIDGFAVACTSLQRASSKIFRNRSHRVSGVHMTEPSDKKKSGEVTKRRFAFAVGSNVSTYHFRGHVFVCTTYSFARLIRAIFASLCTVHAFCQSKISYTNMPFVANKTFSGFRSRCMMQLYANIPMPKQPRPRKSELRL